VKQAGLWRMLEPNVDQFLERVVFPLIMFSAQEQRQFFEEPDQFVHSLNELNKLVYSARVQAMYLLSGLKDLIDRPACFCVLTFGFLDVVKLRKKVHLERFMQTLFKALSSNPPPDVKEACLTCLGTVSDSLLDNPQYEVVFFEEKRRLNTKN
jgi:hypothetical protein